MGHTLLRHLMAARKSCEWHQTLNLTFAPPSGQGGDAAGGADDQEDDDCGRAAHRSLQTGWGDLFAAYIGRFTVKNTSKCDTFFSVGTLVTFLSVTPFFVVNFSVRLSGPFLSILQRNSLKVPYGSHFQIFTFNLRLQWSFFAGLSIQKSLKISRKQHICLALCF